MVDRLAPVPSGGTASGTVHTRAAHPFHRAGSASDPHQKPTPRYARTESCDRPVTCPTKPPEAPRLPVRGPGG